MTRQAPERALARVELGAIVRNCSRLRSLLQGDAELCAVVKADGYGHGHAATARAALAGGAYEARESTGRLGRGPPPPEPPPAARPG